MTTSLDPYARPVEGLADLIQPDRVHGTLYTDPAIFHQELEQIWFRTWVYVGHSSEVPEPGSSIDKNIGPRGVVLYRDQAGVISVCVGPEPGQQPLPRVDHHQGFVFASFAGEGPSLLEHLGAAAGEIDRLVRLSPEGELRLTAGWAHHATAANWKLLTENESDGYHPQFVHSSIFAVTDSQVAALYTEKSLAVNRDLGGGHSELDPRPEYRRRGKPMWWFGTSEDRTPRYVASMRHRYGPEAEQILIDGAPHVMIFPNLFIAEVSIFTIQPLAVDRTVQHVTAIQLAGAEDLNPRMLQQCVGSVGPAGMLLADDTEMYERNQRGLAARRPEWLDLSRGLCRERVDERGLRCGDATDETSMRGFWIHYLNVMT